MSPLVAVVAVLVVPGTLATSCPPDMLAVYSLALRTEWSEDRFPKQYPQWRPPAQWSKTIGELDVSGSGSGLHASNDEVNVKYEDGSMFKVGYFCRVQLRVTNPPSTVILGGHLL